MSITKTEEIKRTAVAACMAIAHDLRNHDVVRMLGVMLMHGFGAGDYFID